MKKHNILKVILLSILVVAVCTWIFPSASYQYELAIGERNQLGIFDLFAYIAQGLFTYFPYVILMTLATGIFYGVSYKIPVYRQLLDKIVKGFEKRESIFLATIMILVAVIVSVSGLTFGMIFVFPFIISLVLLMGYNKLVAASVTVGATMVGIMGTTLGVATTDYIHYVLGTDYNTEILTKVILLVIGLVLLIYNVILYANKTKNNTDKVLEFVPSKMEDSKVSSKEMKTEKVEVKEVAKKKATTKKTTSTNSKSSSKKTTNVKKSTPKKSSGKTKAYDLKSKVETKVTVKPKKKVHTWPYVVIFDFIVLVLALATIYWTEVFNILWFKDALDAIQSFKIFDFPIFAKLLGDIHEFGSWSLNYEIPVFIILMTCLLAFIYGVKFNDFLDGIIDGMKKAIRPAIYMFLVYLVLIISVWNPFQLNITKFLLELTKGLNVITMTITVMISSVFNIENVYVAQSTLPYVTSVITDSTLYPLIDIIFQSVYGLMMLVAPTSAILIGTLTYLDVSYGQWLKHIWKLFLQLLVVLVVIFFILFLI